MPDNRFLLIGNSGGNNLFLLQQGTTKSKIIIGQGDGSGMAGGTVKKSIGKSLVKQQLGGRPIITAKATALGTLLITNLYNVVKSKLVINTTLHSESKIIPPKYEAIAISNIQINTKSESTCTLIKKESVKSYGNLKLEIFTKIHSTIRLSNPLKEKVYHLEKAFKKMQLLKLKGILEAVRQVPSIQVNVNTNAVQRGNLLRITSHLNKQAGQIWMRIINDKGMIVQKPGLVKTNSTGFQILIGTKDLEAGKYIVQVSNHRSFSPLGVSEFEVNGTSPLFGIVPLLPLLPLLPLPDSPDETFKKVIFRTMQDSRVDSQCKVFENKIYGIDDKDLPIPPIHFNCRCWLEGRDEK